MFLAAELFSLYLLWKVPDWKNTAEDSFHQLLVTFPELINVHCKENVKHIKLPIAFD